MLRWIVIMACLVAAPEAAADDFNQGQQFYRAGTYEAALEIWRPLAENGDAEAQYALGVMYKNGQGVERDKLAAARWFALAAAQEYGPAVHALRALSSDLLEQLGAKKKAEEEARNQPPLPKFKPAKAAMLVPAHKPSRDATTS